MMVFRLSFQGWCVVGISVLVFMLYWFSGVHNITHLSGNVISVRQLLIQCVHLSEDAGQEIKSLYSPSALHTRRKAPGGSGPKNELLTDIDVKSHHIIVSGLRAAFEDLKVISEEHPPVSMGPKKAPARNPLRSNVEAVLPDNDLFVPISDLTVWVDPLDATQELTEGLLNYVTVMICVAHHGNPIIGVIHQPFSNRTFWSWEYRSASPRVLEAMAKRPSVHDADLRITHSRSHLNRTQMEAVADAFKPQAVKFIPAGGSGFKVLSLLDGSANLYIHPSSTRRWDICAAHAILESVGGRMTGMDGSPLQYGSDTDAKIPATTGLYAAATVAEYDKWKKPVTSLAAKLMAQSHK